jgi:enoyl-CoA hydratase
MSEIDQPVLEVDDCDGVRRVWFNRPRVHNAQNVAMLEALQSTLADTASRSDIRVLVLGGRGPSFCSGHDLREIVKNPAYAEAASTAEGRFHQEMRLFVQPVEMLQSLTIPTVCRVQGNCLAAGLMFVGACDMAIASSEAVFGSPVVRSQAVNDAEVPLLAWYLGERRAKQMIWLDERLSAIEAKEAGLINWVCELSELDQQLDRIVGRLAQAPREVLALSKRAFRFLARRQGWDDFADYHYMSHQLSHHTAEARALLDARRERLARGESPASPS